MPLVDFQSLPGDARVWVFGLGEPLSQDHAEQLLSAVDEFLSSWKAHGHPLTAARDFRDKQFLAVAVDQSTEGASGCSIDGLFRALQQLQLQIGGNLLTGGRIFWRSSDGTIRSGTRAEFAREATEDTTVMDTTVGTAAEWRSAFERTARTSWHSRLIKAHAQ